MPGYVYTCLLPGAHQFKAGRCSHIPTTINRYKGAFGSLRVRFFAVDDAVLAERQLFKELHDSGYSDGRFGEVYQCSSDKGRHNDIIFYTETYLTRLYGAPEAHDINCEDPVLLATYEYTEDFEAPHYTAEDGSTGVNNFGNEHRRFILEDPTIMAYINHHQPPKDRTMSADALNAIAQIVYFNPEHPENHTVKICEKDPDVFWINSVAGEQPTWVPERKSVVIKKMVEKCMAVFYEILLFQKLEGKARDRHQISRQVPGTGPAMTRGQKCKKMPQNEGPLP